MNKINEALKDISVFKLALVLLISYLIAIIFSFNNIFNLLEIVLLLFFAYEFRSYKSELKSKIKGMFNRISFKNILLIVLLNVLFSYGMLYLSYVAIYFFPDLYSILTFSISIRSVGAIESILAVVIIAPIVEELFFRGVILSKLNRYFSMTVAILVSSFLFGILHDFGGMFSAFVFGICMALLYIKTSNIMVPILAHFLNNLISEAIYYLDFNSMLFSNDIAIAIVSLLAIFSTYLLFSSIITEWRKLSKLGKYL